MGKARWLFFWLVIFAIVIAVSCSTGPAGPRPGTPEFYWAAAGTTFAAGDYDKANNNLEQLVKGDSEFAARAQPWRLIVAAGLAKGYMDLADQFEAGSRANKANPTPFRRQMSDYRKMAGQRALEFAETFIQFRQHDHAQDVALDFSFPTGSAAPVSELGRVGNGILLPEAQLPSVQQKAIQRAVLLKTSAAAGAPEDTAKAQAMFQAGPVKAPHDVFVLAMVNNLYEQAELFGLQKLALPDRAEIFCNQALEALKTVQESKETKDLAAKIEKTLKSVKRP